MRRRKPGVDPLVHELIRDAVEVVVDLDVIVDVGPAAFPFRQLVPRHRQGLQCRPIQLGEERAAADAQARHRPVVDRVHTGVNGRVQRVEREECLMTQRGQHPALGDLDTHLDERFIGRRGGTRGNDHGAVVAREIGVGPVDLRFVATGGRDPALEIVRDPDGGTPLQEVEHPDMRADPGRQVLSARRLGIDQSTGAQHADEQLDGDLFARRRIDQVRPLPREIDKQLLARAMHLSHRRFHPAGPRAIPLAELAVGVAGRMRGAVLLPEEHERDARFFELEVELTPIGEHPIARRGPHGPDKQARFQRRVSRSSASGHVSAAASARWR